jgi:hypothetical protein
VSAPDAGTAVGLTERLELLGVMDPGDMGTVLASIAGHAGAAFDAAIAELQGHDEDEDQGDDEEPYCATCGASIGIFYGRGNAWLHYTGQGTAESPVELFDAGHEPVIAWRPAAVTGGKETIRQRIAEQAPAERDMNTCDLEELAGLIHFRVGAWQDFGYAEPLPGPGCQPIPPLGQRSANAIESGHAAIKDIDQLIARLHQVRAQLVSELRQDEDIRMGGAR